MNDHVNNRKNLKLYRSSEGFPLLSKNMVTEGRRNSNCYHERNNGFDVFAIKIKSENGSTVEHLPRELSLITKFILDRGAKVTATIISNNFRRSPLVQGGLEIAREVTVKILATMKNYMILDRFKNWVNNYYTEPTDEEIKSRNKRSRH